MSDMCVLLIGSAGGMGRVAVSCLERMPQLLRRYDRHPPKSVMSERRLLTRTTTPKRLPRNRSRCCHRPGPLCPGRPTRRSRPGSRAVRRTAPSRSRPRCDPPPVGDGNQYGHRLVTADPEQTVAGARSAVVDDQPCRRRSARSSTAWLAGQMMPDDDKRVSDRRRSSFLPRIVAPAASSVCADSSAGHAPAPGRRPAPVRAPSAPPAGRRR